MRLLLAILFIATARASALSDKELESIGRRVWQNECAGTRDGLTSWNSGENFASLGIGHFIWFPKGVDGPFEESFPKLARFLEAHGSKVPPWLHGDCPWSTRAEFQNDFHSPRMNTLRELLASTIQLQSRFLAQRMEEALAKMLREASSADRERVRENFAHLAATGPGTFALIDYVNFKGEGTNPAERYNGEGWGLMQVLANMRDGPATRAFSESASEVLERRVRNSPAQRNEARWLPGWKARLRSYAE